ncbi:MAG: cytochrome c1 [Pseudomonadales bacterium]|nr:cytochrome c1 [Pseudomonadales bacterium]
MKTRNYFVPILAFLCVMVAGNLAASSAIGWHMQPIESNIADKPSLQRGAKLYIGYCLGCHELQYQRYERTAEDLEIPLDIALESMIFTGQKIGGLIKNAMPEVSKDWFGGPPPDLTMVARVRGNEWLYNYLKTFYVDESRPFGVNNKVFPNVGMPHALLELQGIQRENCGTVAGAECLELKLEEGTGAYNAEQYDQAVYDIVNFLDYVGDPSRLDRERIGIYVLLFLVILGVFTYLLNREFWKDIH